MSRRFVRSPPAPKMTSVQAGAGAVPQTEDAANLVRASMTVLPFAPPVKRPRCIGIGVDHSILPAVRSQRRARPGHAAHGAAAAQVCSLSRRWQSSFEAAANRDVSLEGHNLREHAKLTLLVKS